MNGQIPSTINQISTFHPFLCWHLFNNTRNIWEHIKNIFPYPEFWKPANVNFGKDAGPTNPKESCNEILKILDMGSISIKRHEWLFANRVPKAITKHKLTFWIFWILVVWGSMKIRKPGGGGNTKMNKLCWWVQNNWLRRAFSKQTKTKFCDGGLLINLWNLKIFKHK